MMITSPQKRFRLVLRNRHFNYDTQSARKVPFRTAEKNIHDFPIVAAETIRLQTYLFLLQAHMADAFRKAGQNSPVVWRGRFLETGGIWGQGGGWGRLRAVQVGRIQAPSLTTVCFTVICVRNPDNSAFWREC